MLVDALAALLLVGAVVAFVCGTLALTDAHDFEALYLLVIGFVTLRAAVQLVRPGASA